MKNNTIFSPRHLTHMFRKLTFLLFSLVCFSNIEAQDSVDLVIPTMHENEVKDVAISPDGKFIASCSDDFSIKIWNAENGNLIRTLNGHIEEVWDVDYSPDGTKLVSIGRDGKTNVWNVEDGKLIATHQSEYYSANASFVTDGEHIVLSGHGAALWNWKKDIIINQYDRNVKSNYYTNINVNPDGKSFLSYATDIKSVSVWETNSSKLLYQFSPNVFDLLFATYNADGSKIVTVTTNGSVAVFDSRTGKSLDKLNLNLEEKYVSLINFEINKAGNELLILNYDSKKVRVVDLDTLKENESLLLDYNDAGNGIHKLRFFPNGENFVWFGNTGHVQTGNEFGMVKIFDKKDRKLILTLGESLKIQKPLKSLKSRSGRYICEVYSNYFQVFDAKDQRIIFRKDENNYKRNWENIYVDFCKGDSILAVQNRNEIGFWLISTGKLINKVYYTRITNFKILNDAHSFFVCTYDGKASINEIRSGRLIKEMPEQDNLIFSDFSSNEECILTTSFDETKIWNANDGSLKHTISIDKLKLDNYKVNRLSFAKITPDNSKIIIGSYYYQKGYMESNILLSILDAKSYLVLNSLKIEGHDELMDLSCNSDGSKFIVKTQGSYSGFSQKIIEYDLEKGEIIFQRNLGKSVLSEVDWDNNRYLTTGDSRIDYHDLSSGTIILSKITTDKEYLVIDPKGRFDGTESLFSKLYLVQGLETVPLDSYFEVFYTPDLLKRLLGGESIENPDVSFNSLRPLASIGLLNPKVGKINFRGASNSALITADIKFNLEFNVTDRGGGISEIRVFQNGKLVQEEKFTVDKEGEVLLKNLPVGLLAGKNEFQITVLNADRLEKSEFVIIECTGKTDLPSRLFVLSIGINDYRKNSYDLNFAQPDAKSFYEAVNSCGKDLFTETHIDSIENSKATKTNILAELNKIKAQCRQNDVFIFYYAGHGVMSETEDSKSSKYFIAPHDVTNFYDSKQLEKLGISTEEILQISKEILAQKQIFILDACQSGGILDGVASRGSNEDKVLAKLARSSGTYFLVASGSDQLASEFDALGHGVFTYSLLLGLSGEADIDKDNVISVKELSIYAESKVPELSELHKGNPQYPSSYGNGSDFPLFPSEKCKTQSELKKSNGKYDSFSIEELLIMKEKSIKEEDFLKADELKKEIERRKK